jgi:hypothetical protein
MNARVTPPPNPPKGGLTTSIGLATTGLPKKAALYSGFILELPFRGFKVPLRGI